MTKPIKYLMEGLGKVAKSPYPDSEEGVLSMLADESAYSREKLARVKLTPDPQVDGCWLTELPTGERILCYVANHPMAPGFEEA